MKKRVFAIILCIALLCPLCACSDKLDLMKLEVAERCGFSSSSNFYKIFFAITGKTPSDYTRGK
jgi:hypothetical protein